MSNQKSNSSLMTACFTGGFRTLRTATSFRKIRINSKSGNINGGWASMQTSARLSNKKRHLCSDYSIHNQKLTIRTEAKYLGVTISSDLSWSRNADNVAKKANSTMGSLKRNIKSAPQAGKETANKTFIRPIVDYASTTWAPFTDTVNHKIEMVKRRAARFVSNDYGSTSSVTEMMSNLSWDTLQKRRDLARLSMMYHIVHGLVDIPVQPYLTLTTSST